MDALKIFYSYAHEDRRLLQQFDVHMQGLKHEYSFISWYDGEILPGKEWNRLIQTKLDEANIILLFISPDFIASDYCYRIEMMYALEKHKEGKAHVIPIILRPTDWKNAPFNVFNVLPADAKPITLSPNRDAAFQSVIEGIRLVIDNLNQSKKKPVLSENQTAHQKSISRDTDLPYYVYISDNKLERNIGWLAKRLKAETNQVEILQRVCEKLHNEGKIGDIQSGKEYITGEYLLRWGTIDWGTEKGFDVAFFFSTKTPLILLMAGSAHHLKESADANYTFSSGHYGFDGSGLQGILKSLKFAVDHNIPWTDGVPDNIYNYLFALGFVRGKLIERLKVQNMPLDFPEQKLQFVALVLKSLKLPTQQQLRKLFASTPVSEQNKQEIMQMLRGATDILICTPLYVALSKPQ